MTIKAKLIANVLLTLAIIGAISLTSYISMRFLQEKLSYLTEKSSPFQMRTVELQRELQGCITNLIKVNAARTLTEYTTFQVEAERSLVHVKNAQEQLEKMQSGSNSLSVFAEIRPIADELFAAAFVRITSDNAARVVNVKISRQMRDASTRLKDLDTHIRTLQVTRSAAFATALKQTGHLSTRLRELEDLRNQVKDLLTVTSAAHNARTAMAFLIAQGKIKTVLGRIARNKSADTIVFDRKALKEDMEEYLHHQSNALSKKDEASIKWELESYIELSEMMNSMQLTLAQEIELASAKLTIETSRQGDIFAQSNSANSILLTNSELVALGLTVTGDLNRLFILSSPAEIDRLDAEIRSNFTLIQDRAQRVESSLAKLKARDELKLLQAAVASLAAIRSDLYSPDGILATLKKKLSAIEQANASADKLHAMVSKQLAHGKESVSVAQGEQEKSIIAVNSMVRRSLFQIVLISSVALGIGILFGFWFYRSVMQPLRVVREAVTRQQEQGQEKASLAEAVAGGDLDRTVIISDVLTLAPSQIVHDEMGLVLNAVVGMSQAQVTLDRALAKMTASLRRSRDEQTRRDRLKSGLYELNVILRDEHTTAELADQALAFLAGFLGSGVGVMYLYDEINGMLHTVSTYAIARSGRLNEGFLPGEGLPGRVALERKMICLASVPPGYLPITSALGAAEPLSVAILPIMYNDTLVGVLELGSFNQLNADDLEFLNRSLEGIAIAIKVNRSHQQVNELLAKTQAQTEELRIQQEELQQTNEELAERAMILAEQQHSRAEKA